MADKTDKRLTRDLMLEAVPYQDQRSPQTIRALMCLQILLPTSSPPEKPDLLELGGRCISKQVHRFTLKIQQTYE